MISSKDKSLEDLVSRLGLERRNWVVIDHWAGDRFAIAFARSDEPKRLVYVSTFGLPVGRYFYECEAESASEADLYSVSGTEMSVDFGRLLAILVSHLDEER